MFHLCKKVVIFSPRTGFIPVSCTYWSLPFMFQRTTDPYLSC